MLQRCLRKILLFGDRSQHSIRVHAAEFSQAKFSDAIAQMIDPDLAMFCACAGSTLLFGPRQVEPLDEGG
jgi:hypothetical protein